MCYSAQVEAAYREYLKLTLSTIDFDKFKELFSERIEDASIRIPKAVERWFDTPKSAIELDIHTLIGQYRASQIASTECELFALRERLAKAERILATRPTKAAAESQRIATDKSAKALAKLERLKDSKARPSDSRIFPLHYAPIVIQDGDKRVIRLARYHLRQSGQHPSIDRKFPGLYNARRDNLEKFWRGQFGSTHAVMLVDSFFENVDQGGKNAVLHFTPKPAGTMLIACLYAEWVDPKDGSKLLSFAATTDEPPPEVAAAGHDRMIISLKPENVTAWLTPQGRSREELQAILSDRQAPYYEHQVMAA